MFNFKAGLLPFKKIVFICIIKSPLKIIKSAFCFMLQALLVFEIFTFLY